MAKTVEEQMISDAIKGTETEIFSSAFGKDADDDAGNDEGDRSLEEMGEGLEGQVEETPAKEPDEADDEADDGDDAGDEALERDPKTGQFKPKAETDKDKAGDKPGEKKPAAADRKPQVPPGRLREEADKRRTAEAASAAALAERDAALAKVGALESNFNTLNKQLSDLMTAIATGKVGGQQQQAPQKQAGEVKSDPRPDMFADPDGYEAWNERRIARVEQSVTQRIEAQRVEMSMQYAHEKHGEAFDEAYKAITSLDRNNPRDRQIVQQIWSSPNPGKALMSWHNQVKTLREVGDDPTKYREKVATETRDQLLNDPEFLKQVMEKLRGDAEGTGDGKKPRTVVRLPPSANSARGGGMGQLPDRRPQDNSEAAVFASAFEDN